MFFNTNQVTLLGHISGDHIKKFYSSANNLCVVFELRTASSWLTREGEVKQHYDFHNIIIRDIGKRDVASRYMSLIEPGNKVLIQGRLRSHVGSDSNWTNRVCEIDANCVELVSCDLNATEAQPFSTVKTGEWADKAAFSENAALNAAPDYTKVKAGTDGMDNIDAFMAHGEGQ